MTPEEIAALRGKLRPCATNGGARLDRIVPASEIGMIVETDVLHAVKMDVRIHRHVRDGVVPPEIFV